LVHSLVDHTSPITPDLHASPTRRSSDLTSRRILISDHLYNCVRSVESNLIEARLHLIEAIDFWERESDFHARAVSITRDGNLEVDRKSTRLNSSHGSISYAVFCLKKIT